MKKIIVLLAFVCCIVCYSQDYRYHSRNNTVEILDSVFYGINSLLYPLNSRTVYVQYPYSTYNVVVPVNGYYVNTISPPPPKIYYRHRPTPPPHPPYHRGDHRNRGNQPPPHKR